MRIFLFAVGGSLALELVQAHRHYVSNGYKWPKHYKQFGFWAVRLLIALTGGGLAIAQHVETEMLAVQMGITAPALIQALAKESPNPAAPIK
jgi:hypothetical protein